MRTGALPRTATRLLELLQAHEQPLGVPELADLLALHPNSVREQLDVLIGDGLVRRERAPIAGRGRPPWVYRADPERREPDARVREHSALAGVLAAHITANSADPHADGHSAGAAWGRSLAADALGPAEPAVLQLLDDLSFGPQRRGDDIVLQTCPLLDVARKYPEVVCAVHEGMVAGFVEELGEPREVALRPFAAPDGCVLRLSGGAGRIG